MVFYLEKASNLELNLRKASWIFDNYLMAIQRLMPGLFNLIDNGGSYGRHKLNGENYRIFGFLETEILVLLFDVYV